jgi:DHA1 family tetracycline resistance protein-like MFS transporter
LFTCRRFRTVFVGKRRKKSEERTSMLNESTAKETSLPPAARRSALLIVFLVVFIDLLGFGIVLPLLPLYADAFVDGLLVGGKASPWSGVIIGLLYSVFSAMQFLFAPIWGRISDRTGRRPILLLGLLGSVVFYGLFGFASELGGSGWQGLGLALLFVARIGQGMAGATIATAQAVIADSTTPERRSRGMALIGAAFGMGFAFGPLIGAGAAFLFPEHKGAPGYAAAALSLVALLLGLRLLPETLRPDSGALHRRWLDWRGLQKALATPTVNILIVTFFLATFAFANFEATISLLSRDALNYQERDVLYLFTFIGLILLFTQGGLYQMLARRGVSEIVFITVGMALLILGMVGLGAIAFWSSDLPRAERASLVTWMRVVLAVEVIGFAFLTPSVQALISRRTDPAYQGEVLGVNQSAAALARILGPLLGIALFKLTPSHVLPYLAATALLCLVLPLLPRLRQA